MRISDWSSDVCSSDLPTGRTYHVYINPERDMPAEAFAVHGLAEDFLRGQPLFADIAEAFLEFIGAAPLIAHNADFDIDRTSVVEGKSVSVRVELGGRRHIKKKIKKKEFINDTF